METASCWIVVPGNERRSPVEGCRVGAAWNLKPCGGVYIWGAIGHPLGRKEAGIVVRRTFLSALLIVLLSCTIVGRASAATPQAYKYLVTGTCKATVGSNGTVTLSGSTLASQAVDRITVVITLQYWNGSRWVSLQSRGLNAYNTWTVSEFWSVIVSPGYWYRALCEHSLYENGVSEYGTSATDPFHY